MLYLFLLVIAIIVLVMTLSEEEFEAETIYKLVRLDLIDKALFIYMACSLYRRSHIAGDYLNFLILHKAKLIGGLNFLLNK